MITVLQLCKGKLGQIKAVEQEAEALRSHAVRTDISTPTRRDPALRTRLARTKADARQIGAGTPTQVSMARQGSTAPPGANPEGSVRYQRLAGEYLMIYRCQRALPRHEWSETEAAEFYARLCRELEGRPSAKEVLTKYRGMPPREVPGWEPLAVCKLRLEQGRDPERGDGPLQEPAPTASRAESWMFQVHGQHRSMEDIAREYGCSRQNVSKTIDRLLKNFGDDSVG